MPKEWTETHSLRRKRERLLPLIPQSYIHSDAKGMKRNSLLRRKNETLLPLIPQRYIHSDAKGMKRNSLLKEKNGDTSALNSSVVFSQRCQRNEEKLTQRRKREVLLPLIPQRYIHSDAKGIKRNSFFYEKKGDTSALNSSEVFSQRCQRNEEKLTQRRKREALLPLIPQRYIHSDAKGIKRNSFFYEKKGDTSVLNSPEVYSQRC